MVHVSPVKKALVEELAKGFASSKGIGIASIKGIPAPQFQAIRRKLADRATIRGAKNNLLRLALERASSQKPDLTKLSDVIEGQTAVILADVNPFRLFKELEATKSRAPARGGEVAPEDLWVREGETPFKPGPIVGDLLKAGERTPRAVAQNLARLEIFPLIVGLDLRGAYENGTVFHRDALAIDDAVVRSQISLAGLQAFSLAMAAAYPAKATIRSLLSTAHQNALSLAIESQFPTKESVKFLVAKA